METKSLGSNYSQQGYTRYRIFGMLLHEFSKMVSINKQRVIQKAAVIQALVAKYLSYENDSIIYFESFHNLGYWYQQEIIKLVTRVYCKGQWDVTREYASILYDPSKMFETSKEIKEWFIFTKTK